MTTIKRLLRRLDGYTLEAFNAPATRARRRAARERERDRRRDPPARTLSHALHALTSPAGRCRRRGP